MSYLYYWILGIFLVVAFVSVWFFYPMGLQFLNMHRGFPTHVIQNIVHDVIKDVAEASCIVDPSVALIRVTEASATLETVLRLVGGAHVVSGICKLDVEQLQNTINRQETQIRQTFLTKDDSRMNHHSE
jgi:hypothetical protein